MSQIENYKDLRVWQASRRLVREVYTVSEKFPRDEMFGLRQQIRRAAVSVASNIAEGYGRASRDEYVSPDMLSLFREIFNEAVALLQALIRSLNKKKV